MCRETNGVRQAHGCWVPLKVISNYINTIFNLCLAITALFNTLKVKKTKKDCKGTT